MAEPWPVRVARGPASGAERCPVCQHPVPLLWVHAHLQCPVCRTVVVPCCNGEREGDGATDTR